MLAQRSSRSRKKLIVVTAIIIIAVLLGAWFYQEYQQRVAFKNVKIRVRGIRVISIGSASVTLEFKLEMYNPNSITATADHLEYNLYGNNIYLGHGIIPQKITIPPGETIITQSTFNIYYNNTMNIIQSILQNKTVNWKINGTIYFDTFLGSIKIPFTTEDLAS